MQQKTSRLLFTGLVTISSTVLPALAKDGDTSVRGSLRSLTSSIVTVARVSCTITRATKFQDSNQVLVSASAFTVGDMVKLQCRDGLARELEMENEISSVPSTPTPTATATPEASPSPSASATPSTRETPSATATPKPRTEDDDSKEDVSSRQGDGSVNKPLIVSFGEFQARLKAVSGVVTRGKGKVEYKAEGKGKKAKQRLTASVKFPLPSNTPLAKTLAEARLLNISATLSKKGVAYAHCTLAFDASSDDSARDDSALFAEFKLDLRSQNAKTSAKKGTCDTDLSTEGIQSGIPAITRGDTLTIEEDTSGVILNGTFSKQ